MLCVSYATVLCCGCVPLLRLLWDALVATNDQALQVLVDGLTARFRRAAVLFFNYEEAKSRRGARRSELKEAERSCSRAMVRLSLWAQAINSTAHSLANQPSSDGKGTTETFGAMG